MRKCCLASRAWTHKVSATVQLDGSAFAFMETLLQSYAASYQGEPVRVLIIPGLNDSGQGHWQTWLQTQYRGAVRVRQADWALPDLDIWAEQIAKAVDRAAPHTQWIAVAHSFGCLALAHYLAGHRARGPAHGSKVCSALLVAPADPVKLGVSDRLPGSGLGIASTVIGSENDPWMPLERAQQWATRWGSGFVNLGAAGHINTESGFGPWPLARFKVDQLIRDQQRQRRLDRAHPMELSYAI
jgi:predicted alpha/beta hydrolase family esterase